MSNKEHIERLEALRQFTMGFDDSIDFAISAIKGTESKTEWILLTDKTIDHQLYKGFAYGKDPQIIHDQEYGVDYVWCVVDEMNGIDLEFDKTEVTHWRPLPEPPKE